MPTTDLIFPELGKSNKTDQIAHCIRQFIIDGNLKAGDQLPATRVLSQELKVARGTVITAIEILTAEGLLVSRSGSGTFVSNEIYLQTISTSAPMYFPLPQNTVDVNIDQSTAHAINFQACRPSLEAFPRTSWRKAAAQAASILPLSDYGDAQGELGLRQVIADYLQRARGLNVKTNEIIITNGAMQAIHILACIYLKPGDQVAFEEPGFPLARKLFSFTGAEVIPVAVDQAGIIVDQLPKDGGRIKLIYVTPSHQFPTGARLSLGRRSELLAWAARHNALIIEDDYDGEFRYDITPLPPLAAICAKNHVAYCGTFSKSLFPSLRIGYAVAASAIVHEMAAYKALTDYQTNQLGQLTLQYFIEAGAYEKHIQRMRRIYTKKLQCLKQTMTDCQFPGQLEGIDSGLNGLVRLSNQVSATDISEMAAKNGINVAPIIRFYSQPSQDDNALVLGYSALSLDQIESGIKQLSQLIKSIKSI